MLEQEGSWRHRSKSLGIKEVVNMVADKYEGGSWVAGK